MDASNYVRFVAALLFVLALIGFATWLAKRFGMGGRVNAVKRGERRLHVIEALTVDAKHRAVLIRRDNTEHLVLLGPTTDLVIESGIDAPKGAAKSGTVNSTGPEEITR
jgi:flagellar protein FliO/FliZ